MQGRFSAADNRRSGIFLLLDEKITDIDRNGPADERGAICSIFTFRRSSVPLVAVSLAADFVGRLLRFEFNFNFPAQIDRRGEMRAEKHHLNATTRRPRLRAIYSLRSRSPHRPASPQLLISSRPEKQKNCFQREVIIESNPQNIKAIRLSGDHNERRKFSCLLLRLALRWRLQGLRQRSPSGPCNGETFLPPSPRNFINLRVWVGEEAQRNLNFRSSPARADRNRTERVSQGDNRSTFFDK